MRAPSLTWLLAIAACGSGGSTQPPGKCSTSTDCPMGEFCNKAGSCQTDLGCSINTDCPNGQTCSVSGGVGQCLCKGDSQCASGQSCNAAGKCQGQSYCTSNIDCTSAGFFCDTLSHACIPQGTCAQDLQCPQGNICNLTTHRCAQGCQIDGDCALLDYTQTPPAYIPAACIGMQCVPHGCHSSLNCGVFEVCLSGSNGLCGTNDPTCTCQTVCGVTQFCASCDPTNPLACSNGGVCLTDLGNSANCSGTGCKYLCGLDCSQGQVCPAGTLCETITAVKSGTDGPSQICNVGDTCTGQRSTPCPVQEGQQSAACPCYQDSDCPNGGVVHCDVPSGACVVGKQCGYTKQYTCQTNNCGSG